MAGYWKNPASTADTVKEGWLYTGDMGYMHDGLLYVLGRFKSLLIGSDGEKYSPEGIEEALVEHSSCIDQLILYNNRVRTRPPCWSLTKNGCGNIWPTRIWTSRAIKAEKRPSVSSSARSTVSAKGGRPVHSIPGSLVADHLRHPSPSLSPSKTAW